jgi:hypothetical protein
MSKFDLKNGRLKNQSLPLDLAVKFWLNFRDEFQAGKLLN